MAKLDRLSGDQIELRIQSVPIENAYGYEAMGPSVSLTGRALKADPYLGGYDDDIGQISMSVYCGNSNLPLLRSRMTHPPLAT